MGTVNPQTSWESTVGTLLPPPSSPRAPCSTSNSPPTTPGRGQASPCAMRSSRQVSVVLGGKPGAGRLREDGTPPSVSGHRALCKGVCHSYVLIDGAQSVDTGGKGL